MKKIIALVGRPNVGKSTLFNRLTRSRRAIVSDYEGVTRDRYYAEAQFDDETYCVVDTGGLSSFYGQDVIASYAAQQTQAAIQEADAVFFIVDAQAGRVPEDLYITERLRKYADKVYLLINKADFKSSDMVSTEFYTLGFSRVYAISAEHNQGIEPILSAVFSSWQSDISSDVSDEASTDEQKAMRIALIGRPNVGKSSFVNAMIGEERCIVSPIAGTTRDAVEIEYTFGGRSCYFIDTCGLRRRSRIKRGSLENFSLIKTLHSIEDAGVVILILDATLPLAEQDIHLAARVADEMKPVVIAVNKCDAISSSEREAFARSIQRSLYFMNHAHICYISVHQRKGLVSVMKNAVSAYEAAFSKFKTARLMKLLAALLLKQQPPRCGRFRPKLKYIHQGGMCPPHVIIHGNNVDDLPKSYIRYLKTHLQDELSLKGVPLRLSFKASDNPYIKQDTDSRN